MEGQIEPRRPGPLRVQMFGPLEMHGGERRLNLGPVQSQRLLVGLLADGNKPVPRDRLLMWVWDEIREEEQKQYEALQQLVRKVRRVLESAGLYDVLTWHHGCYELGIPSQVVDLHRFAGLLEGSRKAAAEGDEEQEAGLLEAALRPVQDVEPLAGLTGRTVEAFRHRLRERVLEATLTLNRLRIKGGRHVDQISELTALTAEHPFNEMVTWLTMHALYRAGRQSDALEAYQLLKTRMAEDGMEISQALSELQVRILRCDQKLWTPEAVIFPGTRPAARRRPESVASRKPEAGEAPRPDEPAGEEERPGEEPHADGPGEKRRAPEPEESTSQPSAPQGAPQFAFYERVDIPNGVIGIVNHNR